jgi:UDP-glucose 4-epimerase
MKKIFITGGNGFIGKNIINTLGSDYTITNYDKTISSQNDILDLEYLTESMRGHDIVIHMAAYMNTTPDVENYIQGVNVHITGTLNVLKSMKKNNINKIIFFSSSFVYGNTLQEGSKETDSKNPHTGYGVCKLACEMLLQNSGINYTIVRPSIVYGKYEWFGQSISIFVKQAFQNKKITIYNGSENVSRDYVWCEDISNFIKIILDQDLFHNEIYNLSSHEKITTYELVEKIGKKLNADVSIDLNKNSVTLLNTLCLDNTKAAMLYKFKKLDDCISEYIDWIINNHSQHWK